MVKVETTFFSCSRGDMSNFGWTEGGVEGQRHRTEKENEGKRHRIEKEREHQQHRGTKRGM